MFDVVVVGADDSVTARRAVEAASEIAAMSKGALHIVTVYEKRLFDDKHLPNEFRHLDNEGEASALLQVLSFIARNKGVDPVLHSVCGSPAEAITKISAELKADLVVVGNKGMKGARRVLGSVPNSIAHSAECSVAIIDTSE